MSWLSSENIKIYSFFGDPNFHHGWPQNSLLQPTMAEVIKLLVKYTSTLMATKRKRLSLTIYADIYVHKYLYGLTCYLSDFCLLVCLGLCVTCQTFALWYAKCCHKYGTKKTRAFFPEMKAEELAQFWNIKINSWVRWWTLFRVFPPKNFDSCSAMQIAV